MVEEVIISAVFLLTGIVTLVGVLHTGDLASWLAIGAATAGVVNVIATRWNGTTSEMPECSLEATRSQNETTALAGPEPHLVADTTGSALVEVQRVPAGYGKHLHAFEVVIDGEAVGFLRPGESRTFTVAPGGHEIFVRIDWCRSEMVKVNVERNEKVNLRCKTRANILTDLYWATLGRRRYLRLTQVTS